MISQTKVLILLVCLIGFAQFANCEQEWQIHQLYGGSIMMGKEHHEFGGGNLRTHESVSSTGNSVAGGIMGFIFGPVVFFTAFICLWFNEKRAVIDHRRLKLAE